MTNLIPFALQYRQWHANVLAIEEYKESGEFDTWEPEKQQLVSGNYYKWRKKCRNFKYKYGRDEYGNHCHIRYLTFEQQEAVRRGALRITFPSGEGGSTLRLEPTKPHREGEEKIVASEEAVAAEEAVTSKEVVPSSLPTGLRQSMWAGTAGNAASRVFVHETVPRPVILPHREGTVVQYFPFDSVVLRNIGLVWDDRSPVTIAQDAIFMAKSGIFKQLGWPSTAGNFSGVEYRGNGVTHNQRAGSVFPDRYGGTPQHDLSICHRSATKQGCQSATCHHRHQFACLKEAVKIVLEGKEAFLLEWAENLSRNKSATINLIPYSLPAKAAVSGSSGQEEKPPSTPGGPMRRARGGGVRMGRGHTRPENSNWCQQPPASGHSRPRTAHRNWSPSASSVEKEEKKEEKEEEEEDISGAWSDDDVEDEVRKRF
jgi:hypothetical protein